MLEFEHSSSLGCLGSRFAREQPFPHSSAAPACRRLLWRTEIRIAQLSSMSAQFWWFFLANVCLASFLYFAHNVHNYSRFPDTFLLVIQFLGSVTEVPELKDFKWFKVFYWVAWAELLRHQGICCWASQHLLSFSVYAEFFSSQVYISFAKFLTAELLNSNPKCLSNVSISPECGYGVVGIKPEIYGSLKSLMMGFCNNETWPRNEYTTTTRYIPHTACRKIATAVY